MYRLNANNIEVLMFVRNKYDTSVRQIKYVIHYRHLFFKDVKIETYFYIFKKT